jgi:EmrB/QacA subfamily drug resistance transporter
MSHRQILEALSGLLLGMFVAILSSTVVSNALPTIVADLHASQTTYTWVITATLLATTVSTPIWGKLADLTSKKVLVQLGLIVFVVGSAIAGLSQNPETLIAARVVQGIGAGGLTALAQVIMAAMIAPRERGRYSGYLGAVLAVATIAGPLIGGVIVDTSWLGWRWCFYVGVPFAVIALIVLQRTLHLPVSRRQVKIDWGGATLITAAASLLLVWVSFAGSRYDWLSWQTGAMVGGAVVLALLFLLVESRVSEPIIPLRLFRNSTMSLAVVASLLVGVALFGATTFLGQYFQLARGETPTKAGLLTLPLIIGLLLASTISGQIITRLGRWKVFLIIGSVLLTAGLGFLGTLRYDTGYWMMATYMFAIGAGVGMTLQNLVLSVQNQVKTEELGAASSTVAFFRTLGGAIGVSALGALLGSRVTQYATEGMSALGVRGGIPGDGSLPHVATLPAPIRHVVESAYGHAVGDVFLYTAPVALLAVIAVLFIREVPLRTTAGGQAKAGEPGRHAHRDPWEQSADDGPEIRITRSGGVPDEGPASPPAYAVAEISPPRRGGEIRGFIRGGDGHPVPHAALTLIDLGGRQLSRATARPDGGYSLPTPGNGTFVLIASASEHDPQVATLAVGDVPLDFDLELSGSGGLVGTVRGADGEPVANAMVVVTDVRGEVAASGMTGADGGYAFAGVAAGAYTLAVSADAHRPSALQIEVGGGQTRQDVELSPGVRVRGTVRVKGDGHPLEDARVTLLDAAGNVVGTATTGEDGEYAFADLTGGQYTVIATGYAPVAGTLNLAGQGDDAYDLWLGHPDD